MTCFRGLLLIFPSGKNNVFFYVTLSCLACSLAANRSQCRIHTLEHLKNDIYVVVHPKSEGFTHLRTWKSAN